MAPPSSLPSANRVSEACYETVRISIDSEIPENLKFDLEALAEHFKQSGQLEKVFIEAVVPWAMFETQWNPGHAAIADFLITKAMASGISANYDCLVERYAQSCHYDFKVALDGDEANLANRTQSPFLKFHGCSYRDRPATVWTPSQLGDHIIQSRINKSTNWMNGHLREKDLLFVGFWSDWAYLNTILENALEGVSPNSITVIDPSDIGELQRKAPKLWELSQSPGVGFSHVQESGADALDELRRAYSKSYLQQVLDAGREAYVDQFGDEALDLSLLELNSEEYYHLRRDAEGVGVSGPAKCFVPERCEQLGYFHLILRAAGAEQTAFGYDYNGNAIRVVNGSGMMMATLKKRYREPPAANPSDMVIAVGAQETSLPNNVVRAGREQDFIRPEEPAGKWFTVERAREVLEI
ncbi:SIR2-like domain-containing protein [Thalassospira xiamenensis M-5 = DSM 17429]|nr:SIR2-like domain-containing protein [Thalassospira xiamenensis M-5 = DSM 17429]